MQIIIKTKKKNEIIDITNKIETKINKSNVQNGLCIIFAQHTTCSITTADLDPGTDLDFLDALRALLPDIKYRHPHNPQHTPDHILSSLIGPGVTVPFEKQTFQLGTWQRIVLIELDGPRERIINIKLMKEDL